MCRSLNHLLKYLVLDNNGNKEFKGINNKALIIRIEMQSYERYLYWHVIVSVQGEPGSVPNLEEILINFFEPK